MDNIIVDLNKYENYKLNKDSYNFKMMEFERNNLPYINTMLYTNKDEDENIIVYDNTGQKLSNLISKENYKLDKNDIVKIIKDLNSALNTLNNYLLSENDIMFDFDTIIKDVSGDYNFTIVPGLNKDFNFELSKFLMQSLRHIDINDKEALALAYQLFTTSTRDNFNGISDLLDKIEKFDNNNTYNETPIKEIYQGMDDDYEDDKNENLYQRQERIQQERIDKMSFEELKKEFNNWKNNNTNQYTRQLTSELKKRSNVIENEYDISFFNDEKSICLLSKDKNLRIKFDQNELNGAILIVEEKNKETNKFENISYKMQNSDKTNYLTIIEQKALNYAKDNETISDTIIKLQEYRKNIYEERDISIRQFECKRMNDILFRNLSDNLEELQDLYNKTHIIESEWGKNQNVYNEFKKGFEELCKKYNITEEIYNFDFLKNKTMFNQNNEKVQQELEDIIKKLLKNEDVDIEKIVNNQQLQYIINSKENNGIITTEIPGREKQWDTFVNTYMENTKSVSIDKNGNIDYNGSVLNNKKVEILIGYPASGKSTIANQISNLSHSRLIDSDEVKKLIPEYCDGLGVEKVHEESKKIQEIIIEKALKNNENVIIPIVGANPRSIHKLLDQFTEKGYDINISFVDLPKNKCMARNITRYIETGRLIHPKVIQEKNNPKNVLEMIKNEIMEQGDSYKYNVKYIREFNNDVPFGQKPELTAAYKIGKTIQNVTEVAKIQYNQDINQFAQNKINSLKM